MFRQLVGSIPVFEVRVKLVRQIFILHVVIVFFRP